MEERHILSNTIELLRRTPSSLSALLSGLPDFWLRRSEGEGTWTLIEVVGHLIHGERTDWIPRARIILEEGTAHAFDPFDRTAQQTFIEGRFATELLVEFSMLRAENLATVSTWNLSAADLEKRGLHPALGEVTLSQLFATWATHDLSHLHQITRIMAHQYRDEVGPWKAYLGVLHCEGHSS